MIYQPSAAAELAASVEAVSEEPVSAAGALSVAGAVSAAGALAEEEVGALPVCCCSSCWGLSPAGPAAAEAGAEE